MPSTCQTTLGRRQVSMYIGFATECLGDGDRLPERFFNTGATDVMSAMVKLTQEICESCDRPAVAACLLMAFLPGAGWLLGEHGGAEDTAERVYSMVSLMMSSRPREACFDQERWQS